MNNFLKFFIFASVTLSVFSCAKYVDVETPEDAQEQNSKLTIKTRATDDAGELTDDKSEVSYPVNVYVFDDKEECVALMSIASEQEVLSTELKAGKYDVYAIAGADENSYELPTLENATKESVITLKEGQEHKDLMVANDSADIAAGEDCNITLSLTRKVFLLESIKISNVPDDITDVNVTISPLYENLLLNGDYSGDNGKKTISLTKSEDGVWSDECNTYLLEAAGNATIKISFGNESSEVKTYSNEYVDVLKANRKINIEGSYDKASFTATIKGTSWEEYPDVTFDFNESGTTGIEPPVEPTPGNVPEVGSIYDDNSIVIRYENEGNNTVVTLMSTEYKANLEFEKDNQEEAKVAINAAIAEFPSIEGASAWKLPTLEELKYVSESLEVFNSSLKKNGKSEFVIEDATNNYVYYYSDGNDIDVYCPNLPDDDDYSLSGGAYKIFRAFTTMTINNN